MNTPITSCTQESCPFSHIANYSRQRGAFCEGLRTEFPDNTGLVQCCGLACAKHLISRVNQQTTTAILNIRAMENTRGYIRLREIEPDTPAAMKSLGMSLAAVAAARIAGGVDLEQQSIKTKIEMLHEEEHPELMASLQTILSEPGILPGKYPALSAALNYVLLANSGLINLPQANSRLDNRY
jgi:hypothetical protein